MPKVSVRTSQQAIGGALPSGFTGEGQAAAYFAGSDNPLHLHVLTLEPGEKLHIAAEAIDQLAYIWRGSVLAGGHALPSGSSLIVEHDETLELSAEEPATILAFSAAEADGNALAGGHVHLLPAERAPRSDGLAGSVGVGGVMHADADCPSCRLWLHENIFPAGNTATRQDAEAGIHSHSEHEIIFVLEGEMRLGARLFGAGTALAIAADTLYSFTPGPAGLRFANFRAAKPGDIQFVKGHAISETAYWRDRLPRPDYLAPAEQSVA